MIIDINSLSQLELERPQGLFSSLYIYFVLMSYFVVSHQIVHVIGIIIADLSFKQLLHNCLSFLLKLVYISGYLFENPQYYVQESVVEHRIVLCHDFFYNLQRTLLQ
jgi:type III secretory pathway component EscS